MSIHTRPVFTRLITRTVTGGVALLLSACRSAPKAVGVVQECIHVPGRVIVVPGPAPDVQLQTTSRGAPPLTDPLTGKPAGIAGLVVMVLNALGRPLEGAQVVIPDTDRGRTGKDGRVEFRLLAPREHRMTVSAPSLLPQELALVSRVGFVDSVRVYLTTPSLALPCDKRP